MHSFPFVVKKEMIEKREMMKGCESTVLRKTNESLCKKKWLKKEKWWKDVKAKRKNETSKRNALIPEMWQFFHISVRHKWNNPQMETRIVLVE